MRNINFEAYNRGNIGLPRELFEIVEKNWGGTRKFDSLLEGLKSFYTFLRKFVKMMP